MTNADSFYMGALFGLALGALGNAIVCHAEEPTDCAVAGNDAMRAYEWRAAGYPAADVMKAAAPATEAQRVWVKRILDVVYDAPMGDALEVGVAVVEACEAGQWTKP